MSQKSLLCLIVLFSFLSAPFFINSASLADSTTVGVSAIVGSLPNPGGGGGGGGGSGCGVRFSGFAYPYATIVIQRGTTQVATIVADATGAFSNVYQQDEAGTELFTLIATDTQGIRSTILNFPTVLYTGHITDINGIRFAPTIGTDKVAVKQGDYLTVSGAALPSVPMELFIQGMEKTSFTLSAATTGRYSITVPLALISGEYTMQVHYSGDDRLSKLLRLIIGNTNLYQNEATANIPGDYNLDQRVTLSDFSVLAYWFGRNGVPAAVDLNKDGIITLVDFSILAFYWNG